MARTEVIMPQMGESIAEGTVVQWLKAIGDTVERDENLLEISTDKVDAEIPSPSAGTLVEILVQPGETVAVGTVIAIVDTAAAAVAPAPAAAPSPADAPSPAAAPAATAPAAASDVVMPQMGESIAEGTVVQWLKAVGDTVERDENLLEISTDKVDAEIPSPVSGTLVEILVNPGETVAVGTVVARVAGAGGAAVAAPASAPAAPSPVAERPAERAAAAAAAGAVAGRGPRVGNGFHSFGAGPDDDVEKLRRLRSSPLVRRMAREHDIDLATVRGTGLSGRVTKRDLEAAIAAPRAAAPARSSAPRSGVAQPPPSAGGFEIPAVHVPIYDNDTLEDMSPMRASIARHMVQSRRTSPHAHTVHEFDFSAVVAARKKLKPAYEARGVRLTMTAFIAKACVDALAKYPMVNSAVSGNQIVHRGSINLGVAVALETGLIVPVVSDADGLNLMGLSRAINDVAERARTKKLKPQEVSGGTFTLTNPGIYGSLFGVPIINQPQVAILGCGAVKKRVIVNDDDSMSIKPIGVFCLSFDHRVVDGAIADHFMIAIKDSLNAWANV